MIYNRKGGNKMSNFKKVLGIVIMIIILIFVGLYFIDQARMKENKPVLFSTWGKDYAPAEKVQYIENIDVALTLEDEIAENATWCGTFQLIWNDLKNELAKQDIVFSPQLNVVENLNKGTFDVTQLSDESYYKVYGHPSIELKEKIEKAIKEKFNETSDILDDFEWNNRGENDYFLYTMLKKNFEFENEFTDLEKGKFAEYENISYFGIDRTTEDIVGRQVEVLYYNSKSDFAIKLLTKQNDEVIINKGGDGNTFRSIYNNIKTQEANYKGGRILKDGENLKIPNIKFKIKEEIKDVENKPFYFSSGEEYVIEKALQTIEFELDKKGGKIKSEAGMMNKALGIQKETELREFNVDNTFSIFLIEKGKETPYFAAKIADITKFQ